MTNEDLRLKCIEFAVRILEANSNNNSFYVDPITEIESMADKILNYINQHQIRNKGK